MGCNKRERNALLVAVCLLLSATVVFVSNGGSAKRDSYYEEKLAAAERMQLCMDAVKGYKQELGIHVNPLDINKTGMIGEEYNGITTTLGDLQAKRTTADSDMAALAVQLLHEAGVQRGDTVGAGFSGSFPAMNLAVLSACAEMGVNVVYITSVGASTYGANNPKLTFPDMVWRLVEDGLLPTNAAAFTLGGDSDNGVGMESHVLTEIEHRLEDCGIRLLREPVFSQNLAVRMEIYDRLGPISCFIGVGGNITSIGKGEAATGQGVLKNSTILLDEKSGLLDIYRARGIKVINLLNIKKLVAEYGLPFDPMTPSVPGNSAIYYSVRYQNCPLFLRWLPRRFCFYITANGRADLLGEKSGLLMLIG